MESDADESAADESGAVISQIPPSHEVRRRLGETLREASLLRSLLKLALRAETERSRSEQYAESELSVRARNVLRDMTDDVGDKCILNSWADVAQLTEGQLSEQRNCGASCIEEIRRALARRGLRLRGGR